MSWVFKSSYWIKLLNSTRVLEFNFSTQLDTFSKIFQLNSALFESSTQLKLEYSTQRNQSTLIKLMRLFLKSTHSTTSTMKFSLNMMTKKYYIQLSFITRTCFLLNAITKYMIKNFWSLFKHLNIDDSNWN